MSEPLKRITREQLLEGTAAIVEYPVESMGGGLVTLRPVSGREWMNISNKRLADLEKSGGLKRNQRTGEVKVDVTEVIDRTFQVKCELVSLAMLDPKMTPDEVGTLKLDIINELTTKIREISGIDPGVKEEIGKFRPDAGGEEARSRG